MKNINIFVALFAVLLTSTSCQDFLNTKIDTMETDNTIVYQRGSLEGFAKAFYTPLRSGLSSLDGNLFAAATDEAQQTVLAGNALIFNSGTMNPKNLPENLFKNFYEGIRAADYFIYYASQHMDLLARNRDLKADSVAYRKDTINIRYYLAEAHIAKAYYYSELIKRYGGVPIVKNNFESGNAEYANLPSSSYQQVVDYIVSEIDTYKSKLAPYWRGSADFASSEGRFSLGVALALKTRVLLYAASPLHGNPRGNNDLWKRAAAAANEFITFNNTLTALTGKYALETNYSLYFVGALTSTSNETIFAVHGGASNTLEKANYPIATAGGASGICPTLNLVNAYEYVGAPDPANPYNNRDPRLAATIVYNGSTWNNRIIQQAAGDKDDQSLTNASRTGFYLKKFLTDNLNLVQGGTALHHWPVFRYGEFLLEYAEAMNEVCGPDGLTFTTSTGTAITAPFSAKAAITQVRDRATKQLVGLTLPAITTTDAATFRTTVKHERQVELAFEDYRYWDLLRWKGDADLVDAEHVLNQSVTGVKVTKTNTGTVAAPVYVYSYTSAPVGSRVFNAASHYYYPFSYADVVLSNGILIQNPNY